MAKTDLESNLYWNFLRVSASSKRCLVKLAEAHDLTIVQLFVLCSMEDDTPIPMNKISSLLYCDASNVTGIIDRLLAMHLISRQESPRDRRVKMIKLTEKGTAIKQKLIDEIAVYQADALRCLTTEEKQQLQMLIQKVLQKIDTDTNQ